MFMLIESLTNLTLPSPKRTLAPPGWLLLMFAKFDPFAAFGQPLAPPLRGTCSG